MSTVTASTGGSNPITLEAYLKTAGAEIDPQTVLRLAVAATEKAQAEKAIAEAKVNQALTEAREMADVHFGPQGIAAENAAALWRIAKLFAASTLLPEHFRGNAANCFIGLQLAQRMKVDAFALMQKLYVVHGRPGIEAQLAIAMLNTSGKIKGTIKYQFSGEGNDYGCRAVVTSSEDGEIIEGPKIDRTLVKAEKWDSKAGSKWLTMPEQMYRYRSALFLIRAYWPEVLLGLQTEDELRDIEPIPVASTPPKAIATLDALTSQLENRISRSLEETTEIPSENGNDEQADIEPEPDNPHGVIDPEPPADETEEHPEEVPIPAGLHEAFQRAKTLEAVQKILDAAELNAAQGMIAYQWCEEAKQRIRASRGERGSQKQLVVD